METPWAGCLLECQQCVCGSGVYLAPWEQLLHGSLCAPLSLQVPIVHLHETQSHFGCLCLVRYVPLQVMVPLNNCLSALNKLYSMLYNMCKSLIKKESLFSKNSKKWTVRVCLCITGMNGASYRCIAMHCRANCSINSIHCNFRNWVEM